MARSKAIVVHQQQQQQQQQRQGQHHTKRSEDVVAQQQRPATIRIRRAVLAGKRGPTTPVPSWKLYENPSYDGIMAGSEAAGRQITVSARKLAATLWELQELPLCPQRAWSQNKGRPRSGRSRPQRESVGSPKHLMLPPPSPSTPVPHNAMNNHRRSPYSDSGTYHSRRTSDEIYASETPPHSFEVESQKHHAQQQQQQDMINESKKDSLSNSTDLLKLLSHIRGMEQGAGSTPLAAVLRIELEHTRQRVRELEQANAAARRDFETLLEKSESERCAWQAREQERWRSLVIAAKQEAEEEKRQKRKAEHRSRKLAQQLEQVNSALSQAAIDVERERKARQLMEEVCDELAREIGQDKAEVEELKRVSEKVREEVEEERRMLQMAEVWREERVQMKLAEARLELEEKNAAVDRLRGELESFLRSKTGSITETTTQQQQQEDAGKSPPEEFHHPASTLRAAVDSFRKPRGEEATGSSAEEDLHSIDLNKESLYDRTQGNRWTASAEKKLQEEERGEVRRKAARGSRRRLRRQKIYDGNANEQENGPSSNKQELQLRKSLSRSIDTIPEQHELCMERQPLGRSKTGTWSDYDDKVDGGEFAVEFEQQQATVSPLLQSVSSVMATPQRKSWSPGLDPGEVMGFVQWPRNSRDNSLRAKLLEAKLMEEPVHHRGSVAAAARQIVS